MIMTDWKKLVGKRVLVKYRFGLGDINELKVLEVSPSGEYIKLQYMLTSKVGWETRRDLDRDYEILEVLEGESLPEKIKYLKRIEEVRK